jgi:two-component system LytT family sensor kinase
MEKKKLLMQLESNVLPLYGIRYRIMGIPLVSLFITLTHQINDSRATPSFITCWGICFIFTLFLWEGNLVLFNWSRKLFPSIRQTRDRLIFQTFMEILFVVLFTYISVHTLPGMIDGLHMSYPRCLIDSLIPTTILTLIYESAYFFNLWKEHIIKTETLIHENTKSQLQALKSQLDPHFLFNSLNTLASLMGEENKEAQTFLAELSDVYRYVLVNREKNVVTLTEEMDFLDSYIYLNKIRFRENLLVEKKISPETYQQRIAPLSLQLLMENAIKHNAATKERPLIITISDMEEGYIAVVNNVQEKKILEKSLKLGLQNIVNRYRILTKKKVFITNDASLFTVKIPLLPK